MAKLVDALDLGSSGETHQSSSLCMPTKISITFILVNWVIAREGCVWALQVGFHAHAATANVEINKIPKNIFFIRQL